MCSSRISWGSLVGNVVWGLFVGVVLGYIVWGFSSLAVFVAFPRVDVFEPVARLAFWLLIGLMSLIVFVHKAFWIVALVYGGLVLFALWLGFRRPEAAFMRGFWTGFFGVVFAGLVFNWIWFCVWRLPLF